MNRRTMSRIPLALCLASSILLPASVATSAEEEERHPGPQPEYTQRGADQCLRCHDETSEFPVMAIFRTPHAVRSDERTPMAGLQCEACHGPGGEHGQRLRADEERPPIPMFGPMADTEAENAVCLDCHTDRHRMAWPGSVHDREGLACVDCHQIHARQDPMVAGFGEEQTCTDCHSEVRADFAKRSAHPVRTGLMACSDCHQPHGADDGSLLVDGAGNETCYGCHAEKRGPLLWEHAPVSEDCSTCHEPHGSIHPSLLTQRPPLLCQDCHSGAGHPSQPLTTAGLPSNMPSPFLLLGSCSNCHSQVHGSNHPAGKALNR